HRAQGSRVQGARLPVLRAGDGRRQRLRRRGRGVAPQAAAALRPRRRRHAAAAGPGDQGSAMSERAGAIVAALEAGDIERATQLYEEEGRAIAEQLLRWL